MTNFAGMIRSALDRRQYIDCPRCDGSGSEEGEHPERLTIRWVTCSACDGSGKVEARPCRVCGDALVPILDPWGRGTDRYEGPCDECEEAERTPRREDADEPAKRKAKATT